MIYFVSDLHIGLPDFERNLPREKRIVNWLDSIKNDATEIYFLGDVFEFWYEWKHVIPKHFSRFFGKLAEFSDLGIKMHFFIGNHDLWAFDYFEQEFGMTISRKPQSQIIGNKRFYLAHGDGLGPGDRTYKLMRAAFTNRVLQWIASNFLHPNFIIKVAKSISKKRDALSKNPQFKGEKEWLIQHAKEVHKTDKHDFYVMGHRHIPRDYEIAEDARIIMLGDWINNFTYAAFDGEDIKLLKWSEEV